MTFEDFSKFVSEWGVLGSSGAFILWVLYLVVKNDSGKILTKLVEYITKKLGFGEKKSGSKVISISDVINHDIFNYIDFSIVI